MVRYVAQRGKLWGTTPEESAFIDMVLEGIKDARGVVVSYPFTPEKAGLPAKLRHTLCVAVTPSFFLCANRKAMLAAEVPARTAAGDHNSVCV